MSGEVWLSSIMGDSSLGNKQGVREKYYGQDWAPATHIFGPADKDLLDAFVRYRAGHKLDRSILPEALYIFSPIHWRRVGDLFFAGLFYAVKGKLAEILKKFDLGDGELIEFPIFEADKRTVVPGPFYLLNFGARKNSFLPTQSRGVRSRRTIERDGYELWADNLALEDDDIAVTAALAGPDLWFEPLIEECMFMSGRLHDAIIAERIDIDFRFSKARIVN